MDDLIEEVYIEDDHKHPKLILALLPIILQCFMTPLWLIVSVSCLPLYVMGLFIWGLPPILPAWSTFRKCFTAVFTDGKPADNIPWTNRVLLFLLFLDTLIKVPVNGVCWYIDELVYCAYHKVNIEEPVFMMTAPRTGSTQLSGYLQDDTENFIAPTAMETMFPYIWVWKIFVPIAIKLGLDKRLQNFSIFGQESFKRHVAVLLKPDTWDFLLRFWHFGVISFYLDASFFCWGFSFSKLDDPHCHHEDFFQRFVPFTDCMMKKVMYYRGNPKQRILIKGHFVVNASTFERQYPKGKFFAVVRNPLDCISSYINLLKAAVEDGPGKTMYGLYPATWKVIRDHVIRTQVPFCQQKMSFYKVPMDNKLVIPFTMYVNNLSATLQCIYSLCNIPVPDDVMSKAVRMQKTTHDYTKLRASYNSKFTKSLASLGVNERKLRERLSEYIEWMNSLEDYKKTN